MIQQVNLYQDSGSQQSLALLNPYILAILATCLSLALFSGFTWHSLNAKESTRQQLQNQLYQAQADLQRLQAQYPNQQPDTLLNQELAKTQSFYQNLSQIMELLADNQSDQTRGFSRYLEALAEQADSKVWLTGISINTEDNSITLEGSSFKSEQIPALLQRLQHTNAFKGRHFARLVIQQSAKKPEQIDFSVSSSLKSDTEAKNEGKH